MCASRPTIVIIDDTPANIKIIDSYLAETYEIRFATSGAAGLLVVRETMPELVLLDVMMPEMDGYEVCARLKAEPETRDIPVIFITAYNTVDDEARGLALGAVDYITKPIVPAILQARVQTQVELKQHRDQTVRELLERLSLATKAAGVGVWDYDIVADRLVWNEDMHRLYGVEPENFHGKVFDWMSRLHPDDEPRMTAEYRMALAGEKDFDTEFRILHPDGQTRVLKANATVFLDETGRPLRMLGTNWDITGQRRLLEDLDAARKAAEAASAAKSRFLAIMSHELRTPLNAIIGYGDLLHETEPTPERKAKLRLMCDAGNALLELIGSILDFARVESATFKTEIFDFDLEEELDIIRHLFQEPAAKKGLAFSLTIRPDVPLRLRGAKGLLRQVLTNLIGNALKFTDVGSVAVTAERSASVAADDSVQILFQVRDTGKGIHPHNMGRIFELFEQEDGGMAREHDGIGLGLAISQRLVSLMGGHIWAASEPGTGSCFSFTAGFEAAASTRPGAGDE